MRIEKKEANDFFAISLKLLILYWKKKVKRYSIRVGCFFAMSVT